MLITINFFLVVVLHYYNYLHKIRKTSVPPVTIIHIHNSNNSKENIISLKTLQNSIEIVSIFRFQ